MKVKYPVEAFALAMILYSLNLKDAIYVGILIIFGTLVGMVVRVYLGEEKRMQEVELMTTFFAVFGSIYLCDPTFYSGSETWQLLFTVVAIAMLAAKFVWQLEPTACSDYKGFFTQSGVAYAVLLLIAVVREILGKGTLLGYTILDHGLVATGYSHAFFGFIATGFAIAGINRLFDIESSELQSELIVVPTAIIATPFVVKALPIGFSVALSLFLVIVYLVSVKGRIMYSNTEKSFLAMPIELISVGIVYMILSFF